MTHKLSASALSTFLRSPRSYYWSYIKRIQPLQQSVTTFDHDKLAGTLWADFVDHFYKGAREEANIRVLMANWLEQTDGWVPEKARDRLTKALETWSMSYYQMFAPDDGCRNGSELHLENERFVAYLDGLSSEGVIHEVKTTSRSPQLAGQLWKTENSLQVKLYCVMAQATGICIEYAFKDPPHAIFRGPITPVLIEQRESWEKQLNALADHIYSLGDESDNYICHPDGCCITSRGGTWMCQFQSLCDGVPGAEIAYTERVHRH